jgi:beta-lactamase class A
MSLKDKIQAVIDESQIEAGVAVWHIESGEKADVNGNQSFPMASAFKIPIIATAFQQIQEGTIRLEDRITLRDEDKSIGSGILRYFEGGLAPTFHDLLTLMIIISDNTATDMVVDCLGGAAVIEGFMHELGLNDIYFKMNCKDLLKGLYPPEVHEMTPEEIGKWSVDNDVLRDGICFSRGPENNVSTANDMNALLHKIYEGEIVEDELRDRLLGILFNQQFNDRLPRFLPPHVAFAHKTGTIGGSRNDSGIIFINPNNHVIVTAFTIWDEVAVRLDRAAHYQRIFEVETAMGKIGRLAYEYFWQPA